MVSDNYNLLSNEFIIMESEENELILTNLHIVEVKSKGIFKPTYTTHRYPISKIKEYNGKAQVFIEENEIHIHFTNEKKSYELNDEKEAFKWANEINKLVTGTSLEPVSIDKNEIFTNAVTEGMDTGKAMGEAVLGAIPLPGSKFIGRTVGGIVGGVVGGSVKGISDIIKSGNQLTTPTDTNTQQTQTVQKTQSTNKCCFCGAPISGSSGQSVRCRYCDSPQQI